MEQTTSLGGSVTSRDGRTNMGSGTPAGANPVIAKVDDAAQVAHRTTDKIADKATAQVDQLSGAAHRAVNSAADAATSGAEWASGISEQTMQVKQQLTDAACTSIRARPFTTVAAAAAIGYLLGRLARW